MMEGPAVRRGGTTMPAPLPETLERLPDAPGVYLMKDARGAVVYVGKANSLRARVRSYFQRSSADDRVLLPYLRAQVADLDVVVVENEKEALLLENSLIKQYRPKYNVRLVDDKTYLSLRLDRSHSFPRFTTVRRPRHDASRYFGPYSSARAARDTLKVIYKSFGLRSCSDAVLANRVRPCLYYQIGQCLAPCVGLVSEADYSKAVDQAEMFLGGRDRELLDGMRARMAAHAEAFEYEQAAKVRDRIAAIERTLEKQDVARSSSAAIDVIGHAAGGDSHLFTWLFVREGRVVDTTSSRVRNPGREPLPRLLRAVLLQAYERRAVPAEIVVPLAPEDAVVLTEVLAERRGRAVDLTVPGRGLKARLLEMASASAAAALELRRRRGEGNLELLRSLAEVLRLDRPPRRMECFDMSSIQGKEAVGSMAVFVDGEPAAPEYRHYRIRSAAGGDDYAMMREVLSRRIGRGQEEGGLPDLLVVDGGPGQLAIARSVAEELGAEDLSLLAIAKGPNRNAGREVLHLPGDSSPLVLERHDPRLHLLQRLRDEAHRFAIRYHRLLRSRRDRASELLRVPGIGPVRLRRLLRALGSLEAVRRASVEEISRVPGIGVRGARAVHDALKAGPGRSPTRPPEP